MIESFRYDNPPSAHFEASKDENCSAGVIWDSESVEVIIPERPLSTLSFVIRKKTDASEDWEREALFFVRQVVNYLRNTQMHSYLIYSNSSHEFEIVSFEKSDWKIVRIFSLIKLIWKLVFGGSLLSSSERNRIANSVRDKEQMITLNKKFSEVYETSKVQSSSWRTSLQGLDTVIDEEGLSSQNKPLEQAGLVYRNKSINLYCHPQPCSEKHFTLEPERRVSCISDLTEEEFKSMRQISDWISSYYTSSEGIQNSPNKKVKVYYYDESKLLNDQENEKQPDQQFHRNMIIVDSANQSVFTKLRILYKVFFGASVLPRIEYEEKAKKIREDFESYGLRMSQEGDDSSDFEDSSLIKAYDENSF